ncbi:Probable E3 ubiquitin-protein ligase rha4a [Ancistrocladus abbreviatus]
MGRAQASSPPELYPREIQLKLYQAFIFSIPILFSIILFLLLYLFYLKRRASNLSTPAPAPAVQSSANNQSASFLPAPRHLGLKGELKDKLQVVLFDEELKAWDSQCCVCLGEFELREELLQVTSCKHVFHADCIHHWLHANATCPLCRCLVIPTIMLLANPQPPIRRIDEQIVTPSQHDGAHEEAVPQFAGSSNSLTGLSILQDN